MPHFTGCNMANLGGIAPRVGWGGTYGTVFRAALPVARHYDFSHTGRGSVCADRNERRTVMTHPKNAGQTDTPEVNDSEARKYALLRDGARQAREDMTRILRALALVRVDAATCGVLSLDEQGRSIYVGRLRRVEETLVELERTLAYGARYFDGQAARFEAEDK